MNRLNILILLELEEVYDKLFIDCEVCMVVLRLFLMILLKREVEEKK